MLIHHPARKKAMTGTAPSTMPITVDLAVRLFENRRHCGGFTRIERWVRTPVRIQAGDIRAGHPSNVVLEQPADKDLLIALDDGGLDLGSAQYGLEGHVDAAVLIEPCHARVTHTSPNDLDGP
jgi:hypothetical protein